MAGGHAVETARRAWAARRCETIGAVAIEIAGDRPNNPWSIPCRKPQTHDAIRSAPLRPVPGGRTGDASSCFVTCVVRIWLELSWHSARPITPSQYVLAFPGMVQARLACAWELAINWQFLGKSLTYAPITGAEHDGHRKLLCEPTGGWVRRVKHLADTAERQQDTVGIGNSDLGGVATSATGVEAGVRVIAETTDLPTKMAKIVVSDDRGRYLIPDLPQTNYTSGFVDTGWSTPPKSNPRLEMPDLGASAFLATAWEPLLIYRAP